MVKTKRMRNLHGKTKKIRIDVRAATMQGLSKWYVHVFEELGWMVLAQNKGYTDKIKTYKNSLERLKTQLEHKLVRLHERDRKEDVQIMLNNLDVLIHHVDKDF
jgi:hypothetical protein